MPPSKSRKIAILGYRSVGEFRPEVAGVLGGLCPRFTRRRRGRGRARPSRQSPALAGAEEPAGPLPHCRPVRVADARAALEEPATGHPGRSGAAAAASPAGRARFAFPAWAEPIQRAFLGGRRSWEQAGMLVPLSRKAPPGVSRSPRRASTRRPDLASRVAAALGEGVRVGGDASCRPRPRVEAAKGWSALRDSRRLTEPSCLLRPP